MKKNIKRFSIELDAEEVGALAIIAEREPFKTFRSSNLTIIRYAILELAKSKEQVVPASKEDVEGLAQQSTLEDVHTLLTGLAMVLRPGETFAPAPRGRPRQNEAPTVRTPAVDVSTEKGTLLCSALGGTVRNGSCHYQRYEVTAGGRAVDWSIAEPLSGLSEEDVKNQYSPSKEEYEAQVAKEKEGN